MNVASPVYRESRRIIANIATAAENLKSSDAFFKLAGLPHSSVVISLLSSPSGSLYRTLTVRISPEFPADLLILVSW